MTLQRLLAVCGPSGSGKTTAVRLLCERHPTIVRVATATTRPRRPDEADGQDYLFLSEAEFERAVSEGGLVAPTRYAGHWYGVPLASVLAAFASGRDVAVVVDTEGVLALRDAFPVRLVPVLLDPPFRLAAARLRLRDGADAGTASRTATMPSERESALAAGCAPLWDPDIGVLAGLLATALGRF